MKTKKKITRRSFLKKAGVIGGAAVLGGIGFPNISIAQKAPIKIGCIFPLTGPFSTEAHYQQEAAILAVEEYNARGGVLGRKIELVIRDDKLKPDEAARRTKELIEKDNVDLIFGGLGAHTQLAINEQAKLAKKIFMSISQSNEITQWPDVSPYTFHEAINPYMTTHSFGPWIFKNLGKKWFFLTADYSFGWQLTEGFRKIGKELGIIDAGEIKHPLGSTDYFPYFPKILAAEPEVLILDNFGKDQLNSIKQAHAFGLKKKMKLVSAIVLLSARVGAGDEAYEGVYGGSTFWWELEKQLPAAKKFVSAYQKRWGKPPTDYAGYSYGGMMELIGAIEAAGSLDMKKMILKLEGHEYNHYKGKQWWVPWSHQSIQDFFILRSKKASEKKGEWDLFEVVATEKAHDKMDRTWEALGLKASGLKPNEPLSKLL